MTSRIALASLLVRDYDEAIAHFGGKPGFFLIEDSPISPGKMARPVSSTGGPDPVTLPSAPSAPDCWSTRTAASARSASGTLDAPP